MKKVERMLEDGKYLIADAQGITAADIAFSALCFVLASNAATSVRRSLEHCART